MAIVSDTSRTVIATTGPAGPQGKVGRPADGVDAGGLTHSFFSALEGTLSAGQTDFVIQDGYIPGGVVVFLDGVALQEGPQYTADDGLVVKIRSPAIEQNDVLEIVTNYGTSSGIQPVGANTFTLYPPTPTAIGGVKANAGTSGQFVRGVDTATGALLFDTPPGASLGASSSSTRAVTASTGTISSAAITWHTLIVGSFAFLNGNVTITTNGSGAGTLIAALPAGISGKYSTVLSARQTNGAGKVCTAVCAASNSVSLQTYDNLYPGADGTNITISGFIEIA